MSISKAIEKLRARKKDNIFIYFRRTIFSAETAKGPDLAGNHPNITTETSAKNAIFEEVTEVIFAVVIDPTSGYFQVPQIRIHNIGYRSEFYYASRSEF